MKNLKTVMDGIKTEAAVDGEQLMANYINGNFSAVKAAVSKMSAVDLAKVLVHYGDDEMMQILDFINKRM